MFEWTNMQTPLRTNEIEPTDNIFFPIGTILVVKQLYDVLYFHDIFGKHKTRGIDTNGLLQALLSYKLADNLVVDYFTLFCWSWCVGDCYLTRKHAGGHEGKGGVAINSLRGFALNARGDGV